MSDDTSSTQTEQSSNQPVDISNKSEALDQKFGLDRQMTKPKSKASRPSMAAAQRAENDLTGKSKKGKGLAGEQKDEKIEAQGLPFKTEQKAPEEKEPAKEPITDAVEPPKETGIPKKYKVKVDGVETEVDEQTLIRDYQIRKASDKAFQEASQMRKKAEAFFAKLQSDDGLGEVLQAIGKDPRKLAEEYLARVLEFEMLSPEQKRIKQLEFENQQITREQRQRQEMLEAQRMERDREAARANIEKSIISSLDKQADLPKDSITVRRVAGQMRKAILAQQHLPEELQQEITPESVFEDVKSEIINENKILASKMTPEQIRAFFGDEKLNEFRKWELAQMKNPVIPAKPRESSAPEPRQQKRHFKTIEDFKKSQLRDGVKRF